MKYLILLYFVVINYNVTSVQTYTKPVDDKVQQLSDMTEIPIIPLNMTMFQTYVNNPLRKYSFVVIFTTQTLHCTVCQNIMDEFHLVATSYKHLPSYNHKLFFGIVNYNDGSDVFKMLQIYTSPVIMHFPVEENSPDKMNFEKFGFLAESIARWIQRRTNTPIQITRSVNNSTIFLFSLLFGLISVFIYIRRNNLRFLFNKQMWATEAVLFCGFMISGHVWNEIRGAPLYHSSRKGPQFVYVGENSQFVAESIIVGILNAGIIVGMILMIEAAGGVKRTGTTRILRDGKRRRVQSVVGILLVCVFFSLLMSLFKYKVQGYPFSFLFD